MTPGAACALSELPANVFAAGEVAGAVQDAVAAASGELAGLEAAHALGLGDDASANRATELSKRLAAPADPGGHRPAGERSGPRQVLCLLLRGRHLRRPPLDRGGL